MPILKNIVEFKPRFLGFNSPYFWYSLLKKRYSIVFCSLPRYDRLRCPKFFARSRSQNFDRLQLLIARFDMPPRKTDDLTRTSTIISHKSFVVNRKETKTFTWRQLPQSRQKVRQFDTKAVNNRLLRSRLFVFDFGVYLCLTEFITYHYSRRRPQHNSS